MYFICLKIFCAEDFQMDKQKRYFVVHNFVDFSFLWNMN